jgi:thioesterase domain-containing protein
MRVIDLAVFEADCRRDIPLLTAMQLSLVDYGDLALAMEAPLAPNINNKGTAFGGSIASICLFGGWAVSTLAFEEHGIDNTEIVVYKNEMIFERPARGHLVVRAAPERQGFRDCVAALASGSDARLRFDVDVEVFHDDARCARMRGVYVVWLK